MQLVVLACHFHKKPNTGNKNRVKKESKTVWPTSHWKSYVKKKFKKTPLKKICEEKLRENKKTAARLRATQPGGAIMEEQEEVHTPEM